MKKRQYDYLDRVFSVAHTVKNNLVAECKKAIAQMEQTRAYRNNHTLLKDKYEASKPLKEKIAKLEEKLKTCNDDCVKDKYTKELNLLQNQLKKINAGKSKLLKVRNGLIKQYRLTGSDIEQRVKKHQKHYDRILHAHIAQKISYEVKDAVSDYLYGSGKAVEFEPWSKRLSVSGKCNTTGICFDGQNVFLGYHKKIKLGVAFDKKDPYGYQTNALKRHVHFCRIVRRPEASGWRYFIQLTLSGEPPVKVSVTTGEILHAPGKSRVGIDIGPQTAAVVSDSDVKLHVLAPKVESIDKKLRKINRRMDRSRKASNPRFFKDDGTIIPKNKLAPELLDKYGRRKWKKSKTYKKLEHKRLSLYSKQSNARIQAHNELTNKIICQGTKIYVENMNFKALAKRAKETTVNEDGKYKSKKRFGKSIANKAPAKFIAICEKKAFLYGGELIKINTWEAKASQYVHDIKAFKKKKLSQRWQTMSDGTKIQRDLYSAFLIKNTDDTLSAFNQSQIEKEFPDFLKLHSAEIVRLSKVLSLPASTGVKYIA